MLGVIKKICTKILGKKDKFLENFIASKTAPRTPYVLTHQTPCSATNLSDFMKLIPRAAVTPDLLQTQQRRD